MLELVLKIIVSAWINQRSLAAYTMNQDHYSVFQYSAIYIAPGISIKMVTGLLFNLSKNWT